MVLQYEHGVHTIFIACHTKDLNLIWVNLVNFTIPFLMSNLFISLIVDTKSGRTNMRKI